MLPNAWQSNKDIWFGKHKKSTKALMMIIIFACRSTSYLFYGRSQVAIYSSSIFSYRYGGVASGRCWQHYKS
jgi:hypothetical protein